MLKGKVQTVSHSSTVYNRHYHKLEIASFGTSVQEHNGREVPTKMPAKPAWLLKIPQIITMLDSFNVPVVDRAIIERLFGLRRRRAIELMHHLGATRLEAALSWWTAGC